MLADFGDALSSADSGQISGQDGMCIDCTFFNENVDTDSIKKTLKIVNTQLKQFRQMVGERDRELETIGMELAIGLSESFEALKKIASGDPLVRIPVASKIELIEKLKQLINLTAEEFGELVDLSHEFAIGIAEQFDVLHRVSLGDRTARVSGTSSVELLEALRNISNAMIESVDREITERKKIEKELQESEEKFRTISDAARDAIVMIDDEGNASFWNQGAERIFGYTAQEIAGKELHSVIVPSKYRSLSQEGFSKFKFTGQGPVLGKTLELTALRKDGTEFPVSLPVSAVKLQDKWHAIGIVRDITERKKAEQVIRESERKFRDLFENTTDLIQIITPDGRFLLVNPSWMVTLGYFDDDIGHISLWDIIHPESMPHCKEIFQQVLSGKSVQNVETVLVAKDGRPVVLEGNISCFFKGDTLEYIRCIFHDITERKRMEEELLTLSLRDGLTSLYNRRGIVTLAEQQLKIADRMKKEMLMIYIDLDKMKHINDTFGHQEGDRALIDTAHILENTFRSSDIIARLGGDEFAILALETGEMYSETLVNRLKANVETHNDKSGRSYTLSLSVGVTHYDPDAPCSIEELLSRADALMYEQKKRRKP